jgi:hypothetical protein
VYGTRFAPDGKTYASGGDDGTIRIWTFAEQGEAQAAAEAAADEQAAEPADASATASGGDS